MFIMECHVALDSNAEKPRPQEDISRNIHDRF